MFLSSRFTVAGLVALALTGTAFGHGLELFATGDGTTITGKVTYDDEAPADHVTVQILNAAGEQLGSASTDHDGGFQLRALGPFDHHLVVETNDGHRADHVVAASEVSAAVPSAEAEEAAHEHAADDAVNAANLEAIVARQVKPLRAQIFALERQFRMRDIIGGIGYIVGVLGIVAYFKARRLSHTH